MVEAASLHAQALDDAPASVTVVSREDIRRYGYRTLGEALSSVRGFYLTYDHAYHYAGLRGFLLPGDYNTRFLTMLNGHPLTDNIFSSNGFFGQDFGLDMDLVERVEIIRGPSSALYGTNGIFATINIVTRSPVDGPRTSFSTETGSRGEKKAIVSASLDLGGGANLLLSGSVFHNRGGPFESPGLGRAEGADAESGYHTFANLIWRNWNFTGYFNSRAKQVPTGWFDTIYGDPGNRIRDGRNFVEAGYTRDLRGGQLRWRISFDQYRYQGRYDYEDGDGAVEDWRDNASGDWVRTQLSYSFKGWTGGAEAGQDLQALQRYGRHWPDPSETLRLSRPDRTAALFGQHEWQISRRWKSYVGVRLDNSRLHGTSVSPRAALLFQPSAGTVFKLMYGRAFRNPNAYEQFYDDGMTQKANLDLSPERAQTFEVALEKKLRPKLSLVATGYHYRLGGTIDVFTLPDGMLQYRNMHGNRATGAEIEIEWHPSKGFQAGAALSLGRATQSGTRTALPNSPARLAQARCAYTFGRLDFAGEFQSVSSRHMLLDGTVDPVYLAHATVTARRVRPNLDLQFGLRNVLGNRFYDPAAMGQRLDRIAREGRTGFVKLSWRTVE